MQMSHIKQMWKYPCPKLVSHGSYSTQGFSLGHSELRICLGLYKRWILELLLGSIYVSKIEQGLLPEALRNRDMVCLFPRGQFIGSLSKYIGLFCSLKKGDGQISHVRSLTGISNCFSN